MIYVLDVCRREGSYFHQKVCSIVVKSGVRRARCQTPCSEHDVLLSDGSNGSNSRGRDGVLGSVQVDTLADLAVGSLLRAVAGDVAGLTALVASLASGVQGAAVRGRAVTGDVTKLATSIALHSLSLAVAGKVVRSTALVAGSRARAAADEAATAAKSAKAATAGTNGATGTTGTTTAHVGASRVGASTLN
jgi:hypothetical protein